MLMINSRDVNIVFFLKIDCRLPKIDFFLNYRLLWRHNGPLSSAVKLGLLGGERSLPDRRASGGSERSANGDVDRNSISVVSSAITGGSRHAWTTQEYLDKTDHADRRRYSCDVIKTVRVTEATAVQLERLLLRWSFADMLVTGRFHATHHSRHLTKPTETLLMYFLLCFDFIFAYSTYEVTRVLILPCKKKIWDLSRILRMALYRPK